MLRWFRLLVIALLLPAYGLAAIGVPAFAPGDAQVSASEEPAPPVDDVAALIAELGDTSDDASDHCPSPTATLAATPLPTALPSLGRHLTIDAPLARLLRPPRPAAA
ncbi:MAG TPA: hypothetical protein VGE36_21795 [Roseateles sp.]